MARLACKHCKKTIVARDVENAWHNLKSHIELVHPHEFEALQAWLDKREPRAQYG
jgi:hypothetical protein